jgi:ribA/ribD-fused uncharacterized protein
MKKINNNQQLIDHVNHGNKVKYIYFWGHTQKTDRITNTCFSQWYEVAFKDDSITYSTAEHYMMAQKALLFDDLDCYDKIIKAPNPGAAKAFGRQVKNFNESAWLENRWNIVVKANLLKFSQNLKLKEFLLNTGNRILVEASPVDKIWGVGLAKDNPKIENPNLWKGLNLLGFALMEVREILNQVYEFISLRNPVLPPWLAYPELERYSMGWSMGYGEDYMNKLHQYYSKLKHSEQMIYKLTYPVTGEWKGWYDD